MRKRLGKFYGVGTGPGDPELITLKAVRILQDSDVVFTAVSRQSERSVSGRVVDNLDGIIAERIELIFAMTKNWDDRLQLIRNNAKLISEELLQGKSCTFAIRLPTVPTAILSENCDSFCLNLRLRLFPASIPGVPWLPKPIKFWLKIGNGSVLSQAIPKFLLKMHWSMLTL